MSWKKTKKILSLFTLTRYQKLLPGGAKSSFFLRIHRWWNEQLTPTGKPIFALWFLFCIPATFQIGKPSFYICLAFGIFNTVNYMVAYFLVHLKVEVYRNHPTTAFAGNTIQGKIEIKNIAFTNLRDIEIFERELPLGMSQKNIPFVTEIKRKETTSVPYILNAENRGVFELKSILVTTSYPFGIIRKIKINKNPQKLTIFPKLIPIEISLLRSAFSDTQNQNTKHLDHEQNEYTGNREYNYGDRFNDIDHKAWGRTGYPVTKIYQNDFENKVGLIMLPGYKNIFEEDSFENCLSLNASIINNLYKKHINLSYFSQNNQKIDFIQNISEPEVVYELLSYAKKEKINLPETLLMLPNLFININYLLITCTSISLYVLPEIIKIIPQNLSVKIFICSNDIIDTTQLNQQNIKCIILNDKDFESEIINLDI